MKAKSQNEAAPPASREGVVGDTTETENHGSMVYGAAFNLTNSIVGAGCIGYGGSFAASGGLASLLTVILFAVLTKRSLDMTIGMGLKIVQEQQEKSESEEGGIPPSDSSSSFESIGCAAYGEVGQAAVTLSKCLFSFGCMVAYLVIIKDNAAPALQHLSALAIFENSVWLTIVVATFFMLPLCLLRDMSTLEITSQLKLTAYGAIAGIVITLCFQLRRETREVQEGEDAGFDWVDHWLAVKPGLLPNCGTFVLALVAQHTVHLVFLSMQSSDRNLPSFKRVSTIGIIASTIIILSVGLPVYLTFWDDASSNVFRSYPKSKSTLVNTARLLLSIGMIFTYPMPLFSVRDSLVQLVPLGIGDGNLQGTLSENTPLVGVASNEHPTIRLGWWWKRHQGDEGDLVHRELIDPLHALITTTLWAASLILALSAPSLGVVLNLVGCLTGGMLGFLLPGLFWVKLVGWSSTALILIVTGLVVSLIGTYYSALEAYGGDR